MLNDSPPPAELFVPAEQTRTVAGESPIRVLVVDDEPQIRRFLRTCLGANHYHVSEAADGNQAILQAAKDHPEVVILDLGLPDLDGVEVIQRIREWSDVPIIVLSVRQREKEKVKALDSGADDYLTKPFGVDELLARIRTALRHRLQSTVPEPVFASGGLTVDLTKRLVTLDGKDVKLTPTEYDLLRVLVIHAGKVITHQQLLREVWGPSYQNENHYLRVYIAQLRQKIEPDPTQPRHILTEPGVGYRLREEE